MRITSATSIAFGDVTHRELGAICRKAKEYKGFQNLLTGSFEVSLSADEKSESHHYSLRKRVKGRWGVFRTAWEVVATYQGEPRLEGQNDDDCDYISDLPVIRHKSVSYRRLINLGIDGAYRFRLDRLSYSNKKVLTNAVPEIRRLGELFSELDRISGTIETWANSGAAMGVKCKKHLCGMGEELRILSNDRLNTLVKQGKTLEDLKASLVCKVCGDRHAQLYPIASCPCQLT